MHDGIRKIPLLAVLIGALTLAGCGGGSDDAEGGAAASLEAQWSLAPAPIVEYERQHRPLVESIPEATDGQLTVTESTYAELGIDGFDVIRLTSAGVLDAASGALLYFADDVPLIEAPDLPGVAVEIDTAKQASEAWIAPLNDALARAGLPVTAIEPHAHSAQVFYCREDIRSLSDLEGRKVRAFGTAFASLLEAVGAEVVTMGIGDVYAAFERGAIDCAISGTSSGNSLRWYEVSDYLFTLPLGYGTEVFFVNTDWWEGLPNDVRGTLEQELAAWSDDVWQLAADLTQDGIDCNLGLESCELGERATGRDVMTEREPSEADVQRLQEILRESVLPAWVDRCGDQCVDPYNEHLAPIVGVEAG